MAFHDLTPNKSAPKSAKALLGLGSKFICTPKFKTGSLESNFSRLERDMHLRVFFACGNELDESPEWDKSKLYVKSDWRPDFGDIPFWVDRRLSSFYVRLQRLFKKKKATPNLLTFQMRLFEMLSERRDLLFPEADKGLGPCAVLYEQYIEDALVHLLNEEVYQQLSAEEAAESIDMVSSLVQDWLQKYEKVIGKMAHTFIRNHLKNNSESSFGQFDIMYKIHKGMKDGKWPTRPVCSDVTGLLHGLAKWVTEELLPLAKQQPSYFKDSFALKDLLMAIRLPPNARFFTADAESMYTNIPSEAALETISAYIIAKRGDNILSEALISALRLVFRFNFLKFGDTFWQQISGTAMGTPPAPAWAILYYALHENNLVQRWRHNLYFYKRFIDDVIGIWIPDPDPSKDAQLWSDFCKDMNGCQGLTWKCEPPSKKVNFMDLTISIANNKIETDLYEKDLNLYLYIPPHSSHPRGVFTGLISGQVLRIRRLCSNQSNAAANIRNFQERLLARGHVPCNLNPLFERAEKNAHEYMSKSQAEHEEARRIKQAEAQQQIYFHLQYHPEDPPSREIQKLWRDFVSHPADDLPLIEKRNVMGEKVGIRKLIVAYSRPPNLRNRFSVRDIHGRGSNVSSFLK
eukprot:scaffold5387_cov81-Cyclotella_meneghiniana.AAC.1